jgi:CMP-N-acetylneuraminic acid synthetase
MKFNDIPSLGMRIISAQKSGVEGDIVCSTDSQEYADIARHYGAQVPFLRPPELSTSEALSIDVILHALDWLEKNQNKTYECVYLLEPASPFCRPSDILAASALLAKPHAQSVVTVRHSEPNPIFVSPLESDGRYPFLGSRLAALKDTRRQAFEDQYTPSGLLYCSKIESLKEYRTFYTDRTYAIISDRFHSIEIDTPFDYQMAKTAWDSNLIEKHHWLGGKP